MLSQGRICSDSFSCCHTEIETANQILYLTQSQLTDNRPTSPSADLIMPGAWQGSRWSAIFFSQWFDSTRINPYGLWGNRTLHLPLSDVLTTRPTRRPVVRKSRCSSHTHWYMSRLSARGIVVLGTLCCKSGHCFLPLPSCVMHLSCCGTYLFQTTEVKDGLLFLLHPQLQLTLFVGIFTYEVIHPTRT